MLVKLLLLAELAAASPPGRRSFVPAVAARTAPAPAAAPARAWYNAPAAPSALAGPASDPRELPRLGGRVGQGAEFFGWGFLAAAAAGLVARAARAKPTSQATGAARRTKNASRSHVRMAASGVQDVTFEDADKKSLREVSTFFVDAFWLGSTTFDRVELSPSDASQLAQKVAEDLGPRYGIEGDQRPTMMGGKAGFPSRSLFETKLILARDPSGTIIGCAGIEAALYDPIQGLVFRSLQCDQIVRTELDAMEYEESQDASKAYNESGIGGLVEGIKQKKFASTLVNDRLVGYSPCSLLANVAVAPAYRRTGLGRALCTECEKCTTDEWKIDEIALQVEKDNIPAVSLYRKDGYKEVFLTEDAVAIRLQPSEPTLFSKLPGPLIGLAPKNEKLLKEARSPTFTMSKVLTEKSFYKGILDSLPTKGFLDSLKSLGDAAAAAASGSQREEVKPGSFRKSI